MPPAQQQQPRREPAPPSKASPPAPRPVTAPSTRALLVTLRKTLQAWRCDDGDLRAYDAWATWVAVVTGAAREKVDVKAVADHAAACDLALELTCRALRETAGSSAEVRDAHWMQARGGERLVLALIDRWSQGRRR